MATPNENAQQALCAEISAQAQRDSEEIIHHAQQEAESLLSKARAEAEKNRQERLALAQAEASRRKESILTTVPVELRRLRAACMEVLLQSIFEEVRRRLQAHAGFDYREAIIALAIEAINRMQGAKFILKLSTPDCLTLRAGLAEEITHRLNRSQLSITIAEDASIKGSGLIIQDSEGFQVWDNRFTTRLERLWPELRRQIANRLWFASGGNQAGGLA